MENKKEIKLPENVIEKTLSLPLTCDSCGIVIKGDPITTEQWVEFSVPDSEDPAECTLVEHFCSKTCKAIDDIMKHTLFYGGDIQAIINHLIKDHGSVIDDLEIALNSKPIKALKFFNPIK